MSHPTRKNEPAPVPENFFDTVMQDRATSFEVVRSIINQLVDDGAAILHNHYLVSQRVPYASRTLARELVMNATWALAPLDDSVVVAEPDEDLAMPAIDEWAGGVLPVRDAEATGLRTAVDPIVEIKKAPQTARRPPPVEPPKAPPEPRSARGRPVRSTAPSAAEKTQKQRVRPPPTEAETLLRTFEDVRKRSNVTMKSVTVDADFNVIQIQEPKGLPPSLIVPRISAKKVVKTEKKAQTLTGRAPRPAIRKPDTTKAKKPVQQKLIEPDVPRFDKDIAEVTFTDKIVCAPGVTFRDGNAVKSRPPLTNANQLTRAQYEQYLEEMKRTADM